MCSFPAILSHFLHHILYICGRGYRLESSSRVTGLDSSNRLVCYVFMGMRETEPVEVFVSSAQHCESYHHPSTGDQVRIVNG